MHGKLYRAARAANTLHAITHPRRLPRRAKNLALGRVGARTGLWRKLWGP